MKAKNKNEEHKIQVEFFKWVAAKALDDVRYENIYAVDFGVKLSGTVGQRIGQAKKMKARGVKKGVPDVHIMVTNERFHGMFLELKKPGDKEQQTEEQIEWFLRLCDQGYYCKVADNFEGARRYVLEYMAIPVAA